MSKTGQVKFRIWTKPKFWGARKPKPPSEYSKDFFISHFAPAQRPVISLSNINQALKTLTHRQRYVIKMRFGLNDGQKIHKLNEIAEKLSVTRAGIENFIIDAVYSLTQPHKIENIKRIQQPIYQTIQTLLKNRTFITLDELTNELLSLNQIEARDRDYLAGILFLLRRIFAMDIKFLDLKKGKALPWPGSGLSGICLDPQKYLDILSSVRKLKTMVKGYNDFAVYQKALKDHFNISITIDELKLIFGYHKKYLVDGNKFFPNLEKGNLLAHRIEDFLREHGPLHWEKVGHLLGEPANKAHEVLSKRNRFILVGSGTYDLSENHPELKIIRKLFPEHQKTGVFDIVYVILSNSDQPLSPSEIFQRMKSDYNRYCWGMQTINGLLLRKTREGIFCRTNGKFKLRVKENG